MSYNTFQTIPAMCITIPAAKLATPPHQSIVSRVSAAVIMSPREGALDVEQAGMATRTSLCKSFHCWELSLKAAWDGRLEISSIPVWAHRCISTREQKHWEPNLRFQRRRPRSCASLVLALTARKTLAGWLGEWNYERNSEGGKCWSLAVTQISELNGEWLRNSKQDPRAGGQWQGARSWGRFSR